MVWVVGVDGCPGGWVAAFRHQRTRASFVRVFASFDDVIAAETRPVVVAVDMPMGLLDSAVPGGRSCDREARALLGRGRASSVFSAPVRSVLSTKTYAQANAANRKSSPHRIGISRQTWGIVGKIAEVDQALRRAGDTRVIEVHPELCFLELAGGRAMAFRKTCAEGREERRGLLVGQGFERELATPAPTGARRDDLLDALVALWTAERFWCGTALRIPEEPALDAAGWPMAIWR